MAGRDKSKMVVLLPGGGVWSRPVLACPRCGSLRLTRVARRAVDRLLSLFLPVRRYRCLERACAWQGNLRER